MTGLHRKLGYDRITLQVHKVRSEKDVQYVSVDAEIILIGKWSRVTERSGRHKRPAHVINNQADVVKITEFYFS